MRFSVGPLILSVMGVHALAPGAAHAACTVPNQLTNGQTADATQIMANFNSVLGCVNGAPAGSTNALQYNAGNDSFGAVGPLTNGQIVVGWTGSVPQATQLSAGTGITITNGPGSIMISGVNSPYTPPKLANFIWGNQPTGTTAADTSTGLAVSQLAQSGDNAGLLWRTAPYPSTPVTSIIGVNGTLVKVNYETTGIVIGDNTGKFIDFGLTINTSISNSVIVAVSKWNNATTNVGSLWYGGVENAKFFAIRDDGTNLTFLVGADPNAMVQVYQASRTAFLSTPSKIGLIVDVNNTTYGVASTFFDTNFGN